jgi:hypothetical protein
MDATSMSTLRASPLFALLLVLTGSTACPGSKVDDVASPGEDACVEDARACTSLPDAQADGSEPEPSIDSETDADAESPLLDAADASEASPTDASDAGEASPTDAADANEGASRDANDPNDANDASDAPKLCENGVKDGAETDVDCGGGTCPACDANRACAANGDCMTGNCAGSYCALASGPPYWIKAVDMPQLYGPIAAAVMTYGNRRGTIIATRTSSDGLNDGYATFDFASGTWAKATMPNGVGLHGMTADRLGRVYVVGGFLANPWMYDGSTWTTTLAPSATSRSDPAVTTGSDGLIYEIGGRIGASPTGIVEAYDPALDRWITLPKKMPTARDLLGAVSLGGRIYAIGGHATTAPLHAQTAVEAYDIGEQTWSARTPLPLPLFGFAAAAGPDGRIYVAGGSTTTTSMSIPQDGVLAYDPFFDRWSPVRPLAKARTTLASAVGPDGRIYVLGDGITMLGTVEVYGPVVSVTPSHAAPGATILVTGSNFAASATVRVYLGSVAPDALLKSAPSTPAGALIPSITATVPNVSSGDKVITVVDDKSRYPITLPFTVD